MHRDEHNHTSGRCHALHLKELKENERMLGQTEKIGNGQELFSDDGTDWDMV